MRERFIQFGLGDHSTALKERVLNSGSDTFKTAIFHIFIAEFDLNGRILKREGMIMRKRDIEKI